RRRNPRLSASRHPRSVKFCTLGAVLVLITLCFRELDVGPNEVIAHEAARFRHVSRRRHGVGGRSKGTRAATGDRYREWVSNPDPFPGGLAAFYQGLKESGFVEGKNISTEFRRADGDYDRLPSLAAELVGRNVSVIWTNDVPSAFAAKAATRTTPIVFSMGADPVKIGLVESLSRPHSNLTGMTVFFSVLGPKHVEFLHELLPAVNTIALLGNPDNANFQPVLPD